jgi:hypothetical protein
VPAGGSAEGTSALNLNALPDAVQHIVRAAYGDATGHIFLISAAIAVVGVIAALLLRPVTRRTSLDLADTERAVSTAAGAVDGVTDAQEPPATTSHGARH